MRRPSLDRIVGAFIVALLMLMLIWGFVWIAIHYPMEH